MATSERRSAERSGTGGCPVGSCDGSGFIVDEQSGVARDCPCRAGRIARMRAARLEGRVPRRYRGVSFDRAPVPSLPEPVVSQVRSYVHQIDARIAAGKGMWIVGDVGTGKTTLAMLVSKAALEAGHSVAIYSLPRLLGLLQNEIGQESGVLGLLDSLAAVDLLHIDDLGAQHTTPWRLEQLYSIVDSRYQAERPIIATSNLMPDELAAQLAAVRLPAGTESGQGEELSAHVGARIVSRLIEMCGDPLPLFGSDMRREFRPPAGSILPQ